MKHIVVEKINSKTLTDIPYFIFIVKNYRGISIKAERNNDIILKCNQQTYAKHFSKYKDWIEKTINRINRKIQKKHFIIDLQKNYIFLNQKKYNIVFDQNINELYNIRDDILFVKFKHKELQIIKQVYSDEFNSRAPKILCFLLKKMKIKENFLMKSGMLKSKWGYCFCSKKKIFIKISTLVAAFDDLTIEYILVHELSHLFHHNHSNKFWEFVKNLLPNYKEQEKKLKMSSFNLSINKDIIY